MIKKYFHEFSSFEKIFGDKNIPGLTVLYNPETGHSLSILYLGMNNLETIMGIYPIKKKKNILSPEELIGLEYTEKIADIKLKEFERIYRLAFSNFKIKPKLMQRKRIKSKKNDLAEKLLDLT